MDIIIDAETTGTKQKDQVIELAIINAETAETIFNRRMKPTVEINPEAAAVHGIHEKYLSGCSTWMDYHAHIMGIIRHAKLVIAYNSSFDTRIIEQTARAFNCFWPRAGIRHLCENLDNVNPRALFPQGRINLLVASPECTHHSNARGGVPCSDQSRATAWRVVDWAAAIYIDNILIENVPEFQSWGPLGADGKPMKSKKGATFQAFKIALESLGYRVDYRVLNAADYGDPTCRKRFFLIARRGNKRVHWPEQTHAEHACRDMFGHETKPWVPARKIIDWNIEGQSIFNRKKPLAKKTLARIEYGLRKFGGEDFLVKFFGTGQGVSLDKPMDTVTTSGNHHGLVQPFVTIMKGMSKTRGVDKPLPTLTTKQHI